MVNHFVVASCDVGFSQSHLYDIMALAGLSNGMRWKHATETTARFVTSSVCRFCSLQAQEPRMRIPEPEPPKGEDEMDTEHDF